MGMSLDGSGSDKTNSQENVSGNLTNQSISKPMTQGEQSYKGHSSNSPDDENSLPSKKQPKQLKWVLVPEDGEQPTSKEQT